MMSPHAAYIKERFGFETIEHPDGFISYSLQPETKRISVEDLFVLEPARKGDLAIKLANLVQDIGRAAGCKEMWSQVWLGEPGADRAIRANLAYGFSVRAANTERIFFVKEL